MTMNHKMELMIKREIKTLSKKIEKISVDVERFEKSKSVVEVFDFKNKWYLVEPHLNDPYILYLLNDGMSRFCSKDTWHNVPDLDEKNGNGPWFYSTIDAHLIEILDKVHEDQEFINLERKYNNMYETKNADFAELGIKEEDVSQNDSIEDIIVNNYREKISELEKKHYPKRNTYNWYQCFGASFFLADWQKALAKKVFPNFKWLTIQKMKSRCTDSLIGGHSTTIGIGPKGKKMVFDILLFENTSLDEILYAAGVDLAKL